MQNIEAIYTSTNYQNKYGDPPWGVHKFNHEGRQITVIGNLHTDTITTGLALLLSGEWENSKYGRQFAITRYFVPQPSSAAGLIKYLQQAPGIGIETARKLYELFGDKCLDVVISEPEKAAAAIKWITADQMAVASQVLSASRDKARYIVPLIGLLDGIAFPRNLPDQILERKWPDPAGQIQRNPFCLAKFPRIGFALCDQLRSRLKLPTDMPERQYAAVNHVFSEYSDLTWLPKSRILNAVTELLGVQSTTAAERLNGMVERGELEYRGGYLALRYAAEMEREVAELLMKMSGACSNWPNISAEISKHQQEQVARAFANGRVSFLLGSAGSGKSYVASRIIREFEGVVAACAPTGKAAQRLGEILQEVGVHIQPKTIHSLFKARPSEDGWVWGENHIDADLLVVDEASMLDNFLALHILRSAADEDTHILFVGDPNQLPPVGRGSLLRDWQAWCDSTKNNSYGLLTEIHRNSDAIVDTASTVRQGKFPEMFKTGVPGESAVPNLQWVPATTDGHIRGAITKFVDRLKAGEIKIGGVAANPITDCQILTSINEKSDIGRRELNRFLQEKLNGDAEGDHPFYRQGDKVIITKNGTAKCLETGSEVLIVNGDIGIITHSGRESVVVKLAGASNREVVIKCSGWGDMDLGYALTVHRSQGSEFPITFTALSGDYRSSLVTSRELLYTAITRASHLSVLCGSAPTIKSIIGKVAMGSRKSFFKEFANEIKDMR